MKKTTPKTNKKPRLSKTKSSGSGRYAKFQKIDGSHPWSEQVKDGAVLYPARKLKGGKVLYFNFWLAKEMGLIPKGHNHTLNKELENKILSTFCLQIINEYDQSNKIQFPKETIKKNKYMATRYLQLQHSNKQGKTSGDGRSIWNGAIHHAGTTWDVSSRGTGVTKLAPGAVEAGKPLKSGDEEFGYGCGMAELDELVATAIFSEIFHRQNIATERMLAIIDLGKGLGIGVRAAPNLIRPAHIFRYLKLNDTENLKVATDYLIERQIQNKEWSFSSRSPKKYQHMVEAICDSFAKMAARLDVDYIFAWMDWDGDNILTNAGIIDYGSIRQFGARHDQYRYEDTDRYSTNLNEQKQKARLIVQVFQQIADTLTLKEKPPLNDYAKHPITDRFNELFESYRLEHLLYRVGFRKNDRDLLIKSHRAAVLEFDSHYSYFERTKTQGGAKKIEDGINRPAIFSMKDTLRYLANHFRDKGESSAISSAVLFEVMLASTASPRDQKMSPQQADRLIDLQSSYLDLVNLSRRRRGFIRMIRDIAARANVINRRDRLTGNAITVIAEMLIQAKKRRLNVSEFQKVIESMIQSQVLVPEEGVASPEKVLKNHRSSTRKVLKNLFQVAEECADDI